MFRWKQGTCIEVKSPRVISSLESKLCGRGAVAGGIGQGRAVAFVCSWVQGMEANAAALAL